MKTENDVRDLLNKVSQKIENTRNKCNEKKKKKIFSPEWVMYDREYSKLTAQYNILLEVLRRKHLVKFITSGII